jgi:tetratricopeptide (TPR) repeat protein
MDLVAVGAPRQPAVRPLGGYVPLTVPTCRLHTYQHLGRHDEAIACYQQAIEAHGDANDRQLRAEVLTHLGQARLASGDQAAACLAGPLRVPMARGGFSFGSRKPRLISEEGRGEAPQIVLITRLSRNSRAGRAQGASLERGRCQECRSSYTQDKRGIRGGSDLDTCEDGPPAGSHATLALHCDHGGGAR